VLCNHVTRVAGLMSATAICSQFMTVNLPHTEEELKENIRREILEVPQKEILRVNLYPFKWYIVCLLVQGHHFQHLFLFR
jgi:hypothetical protein